jgi:16S rRNA (guanine966-N2)-methyltransferase
LTQRPGPRRAPTAAEAAHGGTGAVRIIGGRWKRTPLAVADLPGLRPTPSRVRETLFNWLGQDLAGWRCIDAFAGTGALGFEAASRGAASVLLCEQHPALAVHLERIAQRLQAANVRVLRGDGLAALRQAAAAGGVDLVLLDPPFGADLFAPALRAAVAALAEGGRIYLEAPQAWDDGQLAAALGGAEALSVARHLRAGAVHAHLLAAVAPPRATAVQAPA